ncbi:MAG: hypothetical protein A2509_01885 [Candidatus Edwardsbacteria bacterium RIFOXYD12_FULL_50_11]|uniref:Uncharacterized protein n=1 Tax=Candidatus Edwardsbacteria bacterium GWF2_54_11 TaxID=1817851 RepID=A0A1F5RFR8_9BACT|nr:MAG: hypothetical protein A2502_09605 [Candidatus Edwardsbacteria bacterium RifOxyC12_full_54_24]OGF06898.1 MAG: hypothetical protein A2273_01455 [Candidatus Edwardsbacteria bacterium RifOxyA12_full_54_48]OGF10848.1 MAG: hypothetical protein A3K15_06825 [Candidatus Edwardsbacteria bacterium GWE2_54_12]OGF13218.1 MAG: hypothetical protein A2024_09465 [Candidatus Edwardsbacteria bacterium GWF2_54_11]OGF14710.1 MAG: hypothetical protein A2509_01885 [Candidatus Edwardsbacteria bacterium RIFOXYD1
MDQPNKSPENSDRDKTTSKRDVVNIWLDSLDELFSDFDPRSYLKRTVSDDFIAQVRKVVADQQGKEMILRLQLPAGTRNEQDEEIIAVRLQLYFTERCNQFKKERQNGIRNAVILTLSGIALMIFASYITFLNSERYYLQLLLVLFEPGGWFCLWTGLDRLIDYSGKRRKELDFYSRMATAQIQFSTI